MHMRWMWVAELLLMLFFFFKQKTAYEMRISDWSSDVCSSDLADATLLAAAGLHRLGQDDVGSPVPVEVMLPAPAQGAIGIEVRAADSDATRLLAEINHEPTFDAVMMERALLAALGGPCRSPVAADRKSTRLHSSQ